MPHQRRVRYAGKYPRRFEEKYKEHRPARYTETVAKILAAGKTPAGTHRPVMVAEVLEALAPQPGEAAVDCTLGFGGHAQALLDRLQPGGRLLGLDADPIELPKTEARLRGLGFGPEVFIARRSNFAGLPQALLAAEIKGADIVLADLGVSSMQLDDPSRGFSVKNDGLLDLRMNPQRGQPAAVFLARLRAEKLQELLEENADEPRAALLAPALAGKFFGTTTALAKAVRAALPRLNKEEGDDCVRRVFQALRIAVNEELEVLSLGLDVVFRLLKKGGRLCVISFHSLEDRLVKNKFKSLGFEGEGIILTKRPLTASDTECADNPRARSAKMRGIEKV